MKTLIEINELELKRFQFIWMDDYPIEKEGEIVYPALVSRNTNSVTILIDGEEKDLALIERFKYLNELEEEQIVKNAFWNDVFTENSTLVIFPPEPNFVRKLIE